MTEVMEALVKPHDEFLVLSKKLGVTSTAEQTCARNAQWL